MLCEICKPHYSKCDSAVNTFVENYRVAMNSVTQINEFFIDVSLVKALTRVS